MIDTQHLIRIQLNIEQKWATVVGIREEGKLVDSWSLSHLDYLYPGTPPVMIKLDHDRSCPWVQIAQVPRYQILRVLNRLFLYSCSKPEHPPWVITRVLPGTERGTFAMIVGALVTWAICTLGQLLS